MVPALPTAAVPLPSTDSPATRAPEPARLNAYQQAWQQETPQGQGRTLGSPAALANDAMVLVNRFQAQLQAFSAKLRAADGSTGTPVQPAAFPPAAATTGSASPPIASPPTASITPSLHLIVETFDFAVQEHLVTQAATQLTGSVNTLVKGQ